MNLAMLVLLLAFMISAPLAYAWRLGRLRRPSWADWLIGLGEAGLVVLLVALVGRWDIAGLATRSMVLAAFAVGVLLSLVRHRGAPLLPDGVGFWKARASALASIVLLAAGLVYVVAGLAPRPAAHPLVFPLQEGRFVVAQGGANRLLNHHHGHAAQSYAADITAVGSPAGVRAAGLLPGELQRYAIYGATVVSPCSGRVLRAQDGLADQTPPRRDPRNPAGNHVAIACGGVIVELAHLRKGSVRPTAGELVSAGAPIGRVGNSGNTTEPHLHIHAVDRASGRGIPIAFDGRQPVRNRLFPR